MPPPPNTILVKQDMDRQAGDPVPSLPWILSVYVPLCITRFRFAAVVRFALFRFSQEPFCTRYGRLVFSVSLLFRHFFFFFRPFFQRYSVVFFIFCFKHLFRCFVLRFSVFINVAFFCC